MTVDKMGVDKLGCYPFCFILLQQKAIPSRMSLIIMIPISPYSSYSNHAMMLRNKANITRNWYALCVRSTTPTSARTLSRSLDSGNLSYCKNEKRKIALQALQVHGPVSSALFSCQSGDREGVCTKTWRQQASGRLGFGATIFL